MAIELKTLTCPNCGAAVNCDPNTKTATCEFCGTVFDISEMYQEKADRERDNRQDEQIKQIMNEMDKNNDPLSQRRAMQQQHAAQRKDASNAAKIIVIVIVLLFFAPILLSAIMYAFVGCSMMELTRSESARQEIEEVNVDPFNKLNVTYYGISGDGKIRISDINNSAIKDIPMSISKEDGLSNGDIVTIKYEEDSAKDYSKKYILTETERTYTVEGLEEYVTDINEVGEEDLQILKDHAVEAAKLTCKDDDFNYPYDEDSFEIYKIYTMVKKDFSAQQSVFIVSFNYEEEGETKTGYYMASYEDVKKLGSGEYKIDFEARKFIWSRDSYSFYGFNLTSGHASWETVYTDVYLNNKSEWNITEN